MSFLPEFAPDAKSQWRDLEPILQELVLDELEKLLCAPPIKVMVHCDVMHEDAQGRHYVFIRVVTNRQRRLLTITGLIYYFRARE